MASGGKLYGKQTELAIKHFPGTELWPREMVEAHALVKKAAARTNAALGVLEKKIAKAIEKAADELIAGKHADQFPLSIWQSGSGTQFNMNVNEVLATRANQHLKRTDIHPNDHVNCSQSTNDTIPTSIHIAAVLLMSHSLIPRLEALQASLEKKSKQFNSVVKIGRTHLQDAVPLTLGQEFSGYARQVQYAREQLEETSKGLYELAIGGTALGTGVNAPRGFKVLVVKNINTLTGHTFTPAKNLFANMAAHDAVVSTSGALKTIALALMKIANDIRFLGSGPRAGLAELILPANEPGSSIMPGKVNPTQSEMVMMVACQCLGNDAAITAGAATMSNFDMQASKPLFANSLLQSIRLLSEAAESFEKHCVRGIKADTERLRNYAERSLMLVTPLAKKIGYDKAAEIAKKAHKENSTLEEAAIALGYVTREEFRKWVDIKKMIG
ncbi:class II fumarate hydratase [Candidatus Kaiserbacteria bacterium]|nr:class II fumarate hydratase [Candidatus Kaiserbacteria bacterium]